MIAETPPMNRIFAMLLPKIFPIRMLPKPFFRAAKQTKSSGKEVPIEIKTSPMISLGTLK